ncbi:MAG: hypothetical protein JXL84_24650 [Deltaproteobacteria bacterium]|nr:hypothetical protein [Deltaproteobacteria bacterium]
MSLLAKWMALFWTLAEAVILLYMRWGYFTLRREDTNQKSVLVVSSALFGILFIWIVGPEPAAERLLGLPEAPALAFYRWGVWNFLCTLWVALEGSIMIYVVRIHGILASRVEKKRRRSATLLALILFAFFALFQWAFFTAVLNHAMDALHIYRVSLFYIRICGLLWILFEWIVAVYGIKAYALLKGEGEVPP